MSDDGTQLYVTHQLSGAVSVLELAERRVLHVIDTGAESNRAQRIVLHPTTNRAYLPHIRSNVSNPHLLFDTTLFPVLSVIDLETGQPTPALRAARPLSSRSAGEPALRCRPVGRWPAGPYRLSGQWRYVGHRAGPVAPCWPIWRSATGPGVSCSLPTSAPPMWPTRCLTMCLLLISPPSRKSPASPPPSARCRPSCTKANGCSSPAARPQSPGTAG